MSPVSPSHRISGQPSWRLASERLEAFVTETGGHLGPVAFRLGDRIVRPYHLAPWAEEATEGLPPMLEVLRGDFFCLPFGGNAEPFDGENHPPHGETANEAWSFAELEERGEVTRLVLELETTVRPARVVKEIQLVGGHAAVYQRHTISGMVGPMSFGHHAMLRFPAGEGTGLLAVSPFAWGQTSPVPVEDPASRGYSLLEPGAPFDSLGEVPTTTGSPADLSRYPARRGFEDVVMVAADPSLPLAWTAVTFPGERFVWFTLKDPRVLRQTVLWFSNGGRHYPPWDGRHVDVLGLEEVTSYFHFGLAGSAAPNPVAASGIPTVAQLDGSPFRVACVSAVVEVPEGFDHVAAIESVAGKDLVVLTSRSGAAVEAAVSHAFLHA